MAKHDQKGRSRDFNPSGAFVRLPHELLNTPAYRAAGCTARALLVDLVLMEKGTNNGKLYLSVRDAALRLGLADLNAATSAIDELEELGFISMTDEGHFSSRATDGSRARSWRLTWLAYGAAPTHEYRNCRPKNERGRKRMDRGCLALKRYHRKQNGGQETVTPSMERVLLTNTRQVETVETPPFVVLETDTRELERPRVSVVSKCLGNQHTYSLPATGSEKAGPQLRKQIDSARGTSIDKPCPQFLDELRTRTRAFIEKSGLGSQTRLAANAQIAGGTLSKFLAGKGLNRIHFFALQRELGRGAREAA